MAGKKQLGSTSIDVDEVAFDRIRTLLDLVPAGVSIFEFHGTKPSQTYVNDGFYRMFGIPHEKRESYAEFGTVSAAHPDDLPLIQESMKRVIDGEDFIEVDYRIKDVCGEWKWVHIASAVAERSGDYILCYVSCVDITEMIAFRDELQNKRTLLDVVMRDLNLSTCRIDLENRTMIIEEDAAQRFGIATTIENVPECFIEEGFILPDSVEFARSLYEKVFAGKAASAELHHLYPSMDTPVWLLSTFTPMFDHQGNAVGAIGSFLDVTQRHMNEDAYREQIRLHEVDDKNVFFSIMANISKNKVIDIKGNYGGRAFLADSFGSLDELFDRVRASIVSEEDKTHFDSIGDCSMFMKRYSRGELRGEQSFQVAHFHGWVNVNYVMAVNPRTNDVELFVYVSDITRKKRVDLMAGSVALNVYDAMFVYDTVTRHVEPYSLEKFDEFMCAYGGTCGMTDIDAINQLLISLLDPDDVHRVMKENSGEVIAKALQNEATYTTTVVGMKDGEEVHFKFVYMRLMSDAKAFLCTIQNVTDEWRQELARRAELQKALDNAQQSSRAKTDFLSNVSHEIRTPMNAILGMTYLALDEQGNTEATEGYLREIDAASQHLLSIVNDVLDMSRIESGHFELQLSWASIADVIDACVSVMRPLIEKKGIDFIYPETAKFKGVDCYIDALRLRRAIINLLSNAHKFTPEGGRIEFSIENVAHDADFSTERITVRDTGCGMSKDFQTRLFNPFEQESNEFSNSYEGTGLGLSLVKRFVDATGGEIKVESEIGEGSAFFMDIPFKYRVSKEFEQKVPQYEGNGALKNHNILLIDDNQLNLDVARNLLEKEGAFVEVAHSGERAIAAFRESEDGFFDAVLMDVRMPGMSGLEATQRIRALRRQDASQVPIVAMTADALEHTRNAALDAGMNAYLSKPINVTLLYGTLSKLILAYKKRK